MKSRIFVLLVTLSALPPLCFVHAGTFFAPQAADTRLHSIHAAYLSGNFERMGIEMKKALQSHPTDAPLQKNVLALLAQVYRTRGNLGVPADWHLPEEISRMKIGVRLTQSDSPQYSLVISGATIASDTFKQLKLTHYPDQVVLDKQAGIGDWEEEPAQGDEPPGFSLRTKKSRSPTPAGLYLLRVELQNGKKTDGWFLLEDSLNASATPAVLSPAYGETMSTSNPTFHWKNFFSPEYQPHEFRSAVVSVSRSEAPQYNWDLKWEMYVDSPSLENATIGAANDAVGVNHLEKGRYVFAIKYSERRRFGDLLISRDAMTTRPFSIQ